MRAMGRGAFWVIILNLISTAGYLTSALWLGNWQTVSDKLGTGDALAIYACIACSILLFTLIRILMFQWSSLRPKSNEIESIRSSLIFFDLPT